ncbi:MAG: response regulator [Planctomycetota bacterium]|nr:response regulator [Planctomycetota bacterium]
MSKPPSVPTVYIVDDDERIRRFIGRLLDEVGVAHAEFENAECFLEQFDPDAPGCLLLDVRMPGMGGRVLQDELTARGVDIPILFMTGFGDVSMAVEALQKGALDFLEKPLSPQRLLDRVQVALKADADRRRDRARSADNARALALLTPRERQVVDLILDGLSNKQIAFELSVSSQAIDARRLNAMKKLGVDSVAELVAFVLRSDGSGT